MDRRGFGRVSPLAAAAGAMPVAALAAGPGKTLHVAFPIAEGGRSYTIRVRSYWLYMFENNQLGLDAALARARASGVFDYDARIEGLQALDRYTLRIRFRHPEYAFQWWLTTSSFAAVAREVVEAHPDYRDDRYPPPGNDPADAAVARGLAGRRLPLVGTVDIQVIEEAQTRILAYDRGHIDYVAVPPSLAPTMLDGDHLRPALAQRGIALHRQIEPSFDFFFFNLDNPVAARALLDHFGYRDRDGDWHRRENERRDVETRHGRDRHPQHRHVQ